MANELTLNDGELIEVLRNSLYPGAADGSIRMVIAYCRAMHVDPMLKPVHIVPMYDRKAGGMRDVIMPGIGLYRIIAARSGCAGVSEPEFGPEITRKVGGIEVTFPQWCRVTAKRVLASGIVAEFTAKEFWLENYAEKGGKEQSSAPNKMWAKRTFAQLAKCGEAQALRKAFPEVGALPTWEEMEGKEIDAEVLDAVKSQPKAKEPPALPPPYTDDEFALKLPALKTAFDRGRSVEDVIAIVSSKREVTESQKQAIRQACAVPAAQDHEDAPVMTYAEVADRIYKSQSLDELDVARSLIGCVQEEGQRAQLQTICDSRNAALNNQDLPF